MARKQGSHSDITGPRIRHAALRLIARHGYAAVSMRQIAADVGVQAGALYNYIPDKQTLLYELMRAHMAEVLSAWAEADLPGPAAERLDRFTRFHIRHHLPRGDAVFIAYMELRNLTPENFAEVEKMRRAYEDSLESILAQGNAEGAFEIADTRLAAFGLIALLTGISHWYREGGRLTLSEVEEIHVDLVRRAAGSGVIRSAGVLQPL